MFENSGTLQVYGHGTRSNNALRSFLFKNVNPISIWSCSASFSPFNDFVTFSQFKHVVTEFDIAVKRVFNWYNFVELESPKLHVKFQDHMISGSGEEDY